MYKVVLVDDEKLVRQGMKAIVDWNRHGFEVAGEAVNGREALLRHEELKPDLMLVDVRMPGMDGLKVIEEIRKTDSRCHFIILSGHADFSYAKSAIAWGVHAYLLKPLDTEEIDRELARIGALLQRESEMPRKTEQAGAWRKDEFLSPDDKTGITRASSGSAAPDVNELADKLFYALDIGNRDALRRLIEEGLQSIAGHDGAEQAVKTAAAQWLSLALTKLSKTGDVAYTAVHESLPVIADIYEQPDFRTLTQMLEKKLLQLLDRLGTADGKPTIKRILDFIERHYAENLKLETLGELFNYNSGYLGKLFKLHTGDTFNTYLDKVRIKNAKALLESGLKVHQVAARVGYANADYFHLKFKKYLGESPSRYKGNPLRK